MTYISTNDISPNEMTYISTYIYTYLNYVYNLNYIQCVRTHTHTHIWVI